MSAAADSSSLPIPTRPESRSDWRFNHIPTDTEWIESYYPGGYAPIHLRDRLKSGRYQITRKLGYGSFSTVWLARDNEANRFVALKILVSRACNEGNEVDILNHLAKQRATSDPHRGAKYVMSLSDTFEHDGPNGKHTTLVLPVMGPSTATMIREFPHVPERWGGWYPPWVVRRVAKQVLLGLDFLHRNGVVHTDIQPGNVLFSLPSETLLAPPTSRVFRKLLAQKPVLSPPVTRLDGRVDPWAPKYLVQPAPLTSLAVPVPGFNVQISDVGAACFESDLPRKGRVVTPAALRAPELVLGEEGEWDKSIDVWALGCLIFEYITATPLFCLLSYNSDQEEQDDDHLLQMWDILGPLPADLLSRWERYEDHFDEDGKRRIELEVGFKPLEQFLMAEKHPDMSEEEARVLGELLRSILQYDPEKRPTTEKLLGHPWFAGIDLAKDVAVGMGEREGGDGKGLWEGFLRALYGWFSSA